MVNICCYNCCRGFILPDGKFVGKNIIKELLAINNGNDFRIAYKISERHILAEGTARMSVRLAAQVFSNSVAKAIFYGGEHGYFNNYNWKEVKYTILKLLGISVQHTI